MVARHAGTDITIVAGHAIVEHTRVAENCSAEGDGTEMTVRAILVVGTGK